MDIKQLTYFVEIVKEKSFTRAAANCYISQPALSKSIRQLEEELNFKLFIRDHGTFELTPEGEILFADATEIISNFNNIKPRMRRMQSKVAHPIKIAISPLLGNAGFGNIVAEFCEVNPGLPVEYYETDRSSLTSPGFMRDTDLSLLLLPQNTLDVSSDYLVTDLAFCSLVGLVFSRNELGKMEKLNVKSFAELTMITSEDVLHIMDANDLHQMGEKCIFSFSGADYVRKMIVQKKGILIVPDFVARSMVQTHNSFYRLIPFENEVKCRLAYVTKRNARYREIVEQIQSYISNQFYSKYKNGVLE